jgi:large subunit ribosomal protein L25
VEVTCPADAIPEFFEFSLAGLEIGRSLHISAITLPPGVEPTIKDRDFTVATVGGHKAEEEPTPGVPGAPVAAEGAAPAAAEGAAAAPADAKAPAGGKAPAGKEAGAAKPAAAAKGGDKGKK